MPHHYEFRKFGNTFYSTPVLYWDTDDVTASRDELVTDVEKVALADLEKGMRENGFLKVGEVLKETTRSSYADDPTRLCFRIGRVRWNDAGHNLFSSRETDATAASPSLSGDHKPPAIDCNVSRVEAERPFTRMQRIAYQKVHQKRRRRRA